LEEALAWARRGRELDPLGDAGISISWILLSERRYDEGIRELQSFLAVHPDSAPARWYLGIALVLKGQPDRGIPELQRTVVMMHRSPGPLAFLATGYALTGRRAEALRLIDELTQRRQKSYIPAGAFILPYVALRDYNEAFLWFQRAYAEQSNILQFLKVHFLFDPLRSDPRFQTLMRRVGLN
jgi:tetratricopeptide (TPR) repeat protein